MHQFFLPYHLWSAFFVIFRYKIFCFNWSSFIIHPFHMPKSSQSLLYQELFYFSHACHITNCFITDAIFFLFFHKSYVTLSFQFVTFFHLLSLSNIIISACNFLSSSFFKAQHSALQRKTILTQLLYKFPCSFSDTTLLRYTLDVPLNAFNPDLIFAVTASCIPPLSPRTSLRYENFVMFFNASPSSVTSLSSSALPV